MMLEDRAKIKRLNNVIDIKQREIDELNSKNMDLLWEAAQMEKELITLKKEIEDDEMKAAQVQKNLKQYFNKESTDN
jgi:predicted  nucleic acid-binding Zn-ribbon protein